MTARPRAGALGWLGALATVAACADPAAPANARSAVPPCVAASASVAASTATAAPAASGAPRGASPKLVFSHDGAKVRSLSREQLLARIEPVVFTAYDPYYNRDKTFRALPLRAVIAMGFEGAEGDLERTHFVLRALDGYTVPIEGSVLLEEGGYLAIADVDVPGWELIGPQRANPGPYYLVWRERSQHDLTTHPRPWQLAAIEIAPFEKTFPDTVPAVLARSDAAMTGFRLFREQCVRCHAINRQGGRVGPDLNVPQSIVEYRPEPQIRAYIKDPSTFRYGNMPSNPHLGTADLDALIAYLRAMSEQKRDPGGGAPHGTPLPAASAVPAMPGGTP